MVDGQKLLLFVYEITSKIDRYLRHIYAAQLVSLYSFIIYKIIKTWKSLSGLDAITNWQYDL